MTQLNEMRGCLIDSKDCEESNQRTYDLMGSRQDNIKRTRQP